MAECGCEWYKEHNERKQGDFMTKKLFLILIKLNDSDSLAINYTSPKKLNREVYTEQQNQAEL